MTDRAKVLGELLTKLERREAALMEWGFFDVVHTCDELVELFSKDPEWGESFQDLADGSEELFIDDLAESLLLYRVDGSLPRRYRSRFAESVRLLARLRQRFREDDWTHAPELVSQVRLHLAPRRFPVRDQTFDQVWQVVAQSCWAPPLQRQVLEALLSDPRPLKLAAFQVRAIARILSHYRGSGDPSGTVVTAGTGGGKTKSFYIPVMMGIAADVLQDPTPATRVLALYPRNVLLSDQFAEAIGQASIVNAKGLLRRPLRVGALIGDVPLNANFETDQRNKWALAGWPVARNQKGRLVPHLRHPDSGERLVWTDADRLAGRTLLRKDTAAGEVVVQDGVVCLTREDLARRPPDIFLTSIEMLNKELSGEIGRAVLGFGKTSSPLRMVLLDEIHTYEGLTGAQVPWILRRLAYWVRPGRRDRSLHYVGLSATLQDAPDHLAVLSGVLATRIEEIAPRDVPAEVSVEGQEYNVVLKSHPGSGAGVLSTSIQTAMLGGRLLTPAGAIAAPRAAADATQFFGRKVFGFTDNLDVVNRWLPDFKNAEQRLRLARLRAPHANDAAMDAAGQVWSLVATALQQRLSLEQAWAAIPDKPKAAAKVMRVILAVDGDDADNRRLTELDDLWRTPEVVAEIDRLVAVLWAPLDAVFDEWLRYKFVETVRAAVEAAVQAVLPEAAEAALQVESLTDESGTSILLLESDPGGVGIVERLLLTITADPEPFGRAVEWALSTCSGEDTRSAVLAVVREARDRHSTMRGVLDDVRNANDYRALDEARRALVAQMLRHDLPSSKRYVTALLAKALGPGSRRETERWLDGLTRARQRVSLRLGTAVDGRSFAYWLLHQARSRTLMAATLRNIIKVAPGDVQVFQAFLRLTLEPCADSCPECLGTDGEAVGMAPSRRLATLWLGAAPMHAIDVDDRGTWRAQLLQALREHTRIRLRHRADQRTSLATALAELMTAEIDRGFHSSPLRVAGVRRQAGRWETDLEVDPWEGR